MSIHSGSFQEPPRIQRRPSDDSFQAHSLTLPPMSNVPYGPTPRKLPTRAGHEVGLHGKAARHLPLDGLQPDRERREGRLQFMRDSMQKAVLLLVSANLPYQEDGIQYQAGDHDSEEYDADDQDAQLAPMEDDPTNVQRDRRCDDTRTQRDKKADRFAAAADAHGSVGQP